MSEASRARRGVADWAGGSSFLTTLAVVFGLLLIQVIVLLLMGRI